MQNRGSSAPARVTSMDFDNSRASALSALVVGESEVSPESKVSLPNVCKITPKLKKKKELVSSIKFFPYKILEKYFKKINLFQYIMSYGIYKKINKLKYYIFILKLLLLTRIVLITLKGVEL